MIGKSLVDINLDDLRGLVGSAHESKTLEFKRELAPGHKGEMAFLSGVSALTNTAGGDFIVGVSEKNGIAESVVGVPLADIDGEKLRLINLLNTTLEPRMPRVDIHHVQCAEGRYVLIVRVPFSWIGPHRVKKDNKFYGRTSVNTYPLDVGELRTAFTLGESVAERIRSFRTQRLAKIAAAETPVPLTNAAATVLHLIPLPPMATRQTLDITTAVEKGHHFPLPLGTMGHSNQPGVNLDGIFSAEISGTKQSRGYVQLFRNGAIEGVASMNKADDSGAPYIADMPFANMVVAAARQYLGVINDLNFGFPVFAMLSFVGIEGCRLRYATDLGGTWYQSDSLHGTVIALPEVVFDNATVNVPNAMKPALDITWNAFGLAKCTAYDGQGKWKGT